MKKFVPIIAGAAALLASTVAAFAATDTGTIQRIEWGLGTITLDSGNTYIVPPGLQETFALHVGQKVKITYSDKLVSAIALTS